MPLPTIVADARRDLADLVAIPSVSARGEGGDACASKVAALLSGAGFRTDVLPGKVAPFVVGETGEGPFTLVIYNHYDVQAEDPVSAWTSPPFALTERNGRLFGRGAADDKGEFVSRLAGWRLFRRANPDSLPFRLIWIVDGEEEIGSPSLSGLIASRFPGLRADLCWWEYGEIDPTGRPIVLLGFKGLCALELECRTAEADLHSSLGAIFDDPLWRIAAAVGSFRDAAGRILIDGFYDGVEAPGQAVRDLVAEPAFALDDLKAATGGGAMIAGVDSGNFYERLNLEPCLTVNGIHGGFGGEGTKNVLPSRAVAKVDFRLAPGQDPRGIAGLVRRHLDRLGFADIGMTILDAEVAGVRSDHRHWSVTLGCELLERHFGRKPILQPSSAASGLAHPFVHDLGATLFGAGLTHHGAKLHSPDENIVIDHLETMIDFSADFLAALAARARRDPSSDPAEVDVP